MGIVVPSIVFFFISQYEDNRVQEFTEPDYEKVMLLKEEDLKNTDEWLAEKAHFWLF